jgi:hypothetical protein
VILEKSKRLLIRDVKKFSYQQDPRIKIEDVHYPGDTGQVFDLMMEVGERPVRILLFDSQYGRNSLLTGRFIYGKEARRIYGNCTATVAKTLLRHFPETLGYVEKAREHRILRAGEALKIAPYISGLKSQGDDFKRQPSEDINMYKAKATGDINWGPEITRVFSDVCPATGSTMEAFTKKAIAETNLENIIFNSSTSTVNSLYRVIPGIPSRINVTFICWEALYSVWRKDISLPDGQKVHAGTIINLNPDPDFPHFNPIVPLDVMNYIHDIFQRDNLSLLPDVPGEVGEKIQDNWIEPLSYDFLEFSCLGLDLLKDPWRDKSWNAWNKPGVKEHLKQKASGTFEKLSEKFRHFSVNQCKELSSCM